MSAKTFWDASGRPISATQFVQNLFGKLPELFRDEDDSGASGGNLTPVQRLWPVWQSEGLTEKPWPQSDR